MNPMTVSGCLLAAWYGMLISWGILAMLREFGLTGTAIPSAVVYGSLVLLLFGTVSVALCRIYR